MRTTVIPAQITTVEDRIAGSISLQQLLILITPVFVGSLLFVVLPPFYAYATYKIVIIVCMAVTCGLLAIRFRGKIVLLWLMTLLRYNSRPRYYVLDKNDLHLREEAEPAEAVQAEDMAPKKNANAPSVQQLSTADVIAVEAILADPTVKPHFEINKKGELRVHLTEITQ